MVLNILRIIVVALPYFLDWALGKPDKVARLLKRQYKSPAKKKKTKEEIDKQVERHINAIVVAYDGGDISREQKKELDDSYHAVIGGY